MHETESAQTSLSFEFFPPRSPEAVAKLASTCSELTALKPEFFSVTYGAGGSTRDLTLDTVLSVKTQTRVDTAPHLSCVGSSLDDILATLESYSVAGITRLVALRGDMPSGTTGLGELRFASELVAFIRREYGARFHLEVAAYPEVHPQAAGAQADLDHFKEKVDAGADSAITQYFYNPDAYFRFVDSCSAAGIDIPIIAGIMPVTNYTNLKRFSDMCGAEIPRWMLKRLQDFGDDRESLQAFGIDVTTALCERLMDAPVPGFHFYSMNQSQACIAVCSNLGLAGK